MDTAMVEMVIKDNLEPPVKKITVDGVGSEATGKEHRERERVCVCMCVGGGGGGGGGG